MLRAPAKPGLACILAALIALITAACSPKASNGEAARPAPDVARVAEGEGVAAAYEPAAADPREAALSKIVLQLLEREHLLKRPIDDAVSRLAFKTYLDRLDGGKMFLLEADRKKLARHADKLDDELRAGTFTLAHEGSKIYAERVAFVAKEVARLLDQPFDLTDEEFVELDAKKLQLAATEQELVERWRRRLELEVLERLAQMEARLAAAAKKPTAAKKPATPPQVQAPIVAGDAADDDDEDDRTATPLAKIPATPEAREAKVRADLATTYAGRFARLRTAGPLDAAADMINAITTALDPHTNYLPPADKANFDIQMSGSLEGIGAVLRERDHYIEVMELVPGGASWRHGGISPGDLILAVQAEGQDPVDVFDRRIDEVVKMIRGPKGTVVRLRLQKPTNDEQTVAITRDVVVIEEAYARGAVLTRPGQPAYGYIHVPSFYGGNAAGQRTAAGDVRRLLAELKAKKVAGVVLDMRSNGGGLLRDAVEMTGHLIDRGPVVQVQDSRGKKEVLSDDDPGVEYAGPVVVLVDRFSASASEIVAGALQDYRRAVIVGTGPTHGKGTVQTLADLDRAAGGQIELGVVKITVQQFFRVSGASTQREGVVPDIVLPDPAGHVEAGERELEHAIAWSKIAPAPHQPWPAAWSAADLAKKSAARVAKNPLLSKIAATTELLRARRADTRVPLARTTFEARREQQRRALEATSPDLKKAPPAFAVKVIESPGATVTPRPGGKPDDRLARWRDALARDPWVDESLHVLGDMK